MNAIVGYEWAETPTCNYLPESSEYVHYMIQFTPNPPPYPSPPEYDGLENCITYSLDDINQEGDTGYFTRRLDAECVCRFCTVPFSTTPGIETTTPETIITSEPETIITSEPETTAETTPPTPEPPMPDQQHSFCVEHGIGVCAAAPGPPPICDELGVALNGITQCVCGYIAHTLLSSECFLEQAQPEHHVCAFVIGFPEPYQGVAGGFLDCLGNYVSNLLFISPSSRVVTEIAQDGNSVRFLIGGTLRPQPTPGEDLDTCLLVYQNGFVC